MKSDREKKGKVNKKTLSNDFLATKKKSKKPTSSAIGCVPIKNCLLEIKWEEKCHKVKTWNDS